MSNTKRRRISSSDCTTATNLQPLCDHCQYIFDHWGDVADEVEDEYEVKFPHNENIFALQAAAARGCALCGQFIRSLVLRGEEEILREATIDLFNKGLTSSTGWVRVVSFSRILFRRPQIFAGCRFLELGFRVRSHTDFQCKVAMIPALDTGFPTGESSQRLPANNVDSLWLARKWLENCYQSHEACRVSQPSLPRRLLFLDRQYLRLCSTSSLTSSQRYATLSHCWGSIKLLKLTTQNKNLLQEGIPISAVCKTFRDAAYVTQNLGLQYLWIDSLCIIQDDPEDWTRESKLMGSVYGSSSINLAAASAANGNDGLLFNRDSTRVWRHRVKTTIKGQDTYYDCVEDGIADACLFQTPLAKRAWVVQERLLSPRTLYFSTSQMFWECNSLRACEAYPDEFPEMLSYGDFYLHKQPVSKSLWWKIVQLYSICNLTYSKDKLVAISGVARKIFNSNPADSYLAGLWRRDIETQLCWKSRSRTSKPLPPRAPTWSWASSDGTISCAIPSQGRKYIKVLDATISPYDPFGEVPEGKLRICCDCLIYGFFDESAKFFGSHILLGSTSHEFRTSLDYLDIQTTSVYLLPVLDAVSSGSKFLRGLLLQPTGLSQGQYQRIGYFEYSYNEHFHEFDTLWSDPAILTKDSEYGVVDKSHDVELRTISIT